MALLNEILKWTEEKLPLWQRDAVRRLFQKEDDLSSSDCDELYALMKAAHSLPNPEELVPDPLKAAHLPAALEAGKTVILEAMRDLKYVNRIAPEQILHFAPSGMSVIYGGNGSGKSGYTRVMKRACRARDQVEKVHPDANDPAAQNLVPEAKFEVEVDGVAKIVQWASDSDSPDELATIAVFDSHCARAYLTAEQDVAYLPYGLDVIENLANKVLPELTTRLQEEIAGINIDLQPFNHLLGETEVGRLLTSLSRKTDPEKVKALGTLSAIESKRTEELDQALGEADPSTKAKELRLSARRLKGLAERIDVNIAWVSDDAISKLREKSDATIAANKVEKEAADALRAGESLLPGTGEQVWKGLFNAARRFSTEVAYPENEFPYTTPDAVCLLCQQPLKGAAERLKRFEEYIQNDVAKAAAQKRQELDGVIEKIKGATLGLGLDESLSDELSHHDVVTASMASEFQTSIEARRTGMLAALSTHDWEGLPALGENPRQRIRDLAARQFKSARTFERAADEATNKALKAEREELRARQNLSTCLNAVLSLIERMKEKHALEACKKDLKTKPISDKSKELASCAVTASLKDALDNEFKNLGIGHIGTKLQERNVKGKIKHRLLLDLPTTTKLDEILSEGEQRAIALGSFLSELTLANHSGGIVFDDPVSSLDHKRRDKVAKRLASESRQRQVLVFTHDVVFLHQLRDECEKLAQPPYLSFLETAGIYSGKVSEGLPWAHKSFGERIDSLEKAQKRFEKLPWPADPSEELASDIIRQYSFLRATIERVVQDLALNATVQRFRDYIEVKRLQKVVGLEKSEVDEILRLYQRCHDLVEAHDPSSAKDGSPPTPDELKQDIDDLKRLIQQIKDRGK